jgi:enoyl-[acyl-carrier protein] reductase III
MKHANKIALVTGASRGIGRVIALRLAKEGAGIAVNYLRKTSAAEETCKEIRTLGRDAIAVKANLSEPESIERLFQEVKAHYGGLDILIHSAASGFNRPAEEQTVKGWDWTMNINARAFLLCAQQAIPLMEARGGGVILGISSPGSAFVLPDYIAVGASKGALETLIRYMAVELAPKKIVVNGISPGVVETDALKHFRTFKEVDVLAEAINATPVHRLVQPEEVASLASFLCSKDADMIRGQVIVIDGGVTLPLRGGIPWDQIRKQMQ